MRSMVQQPVVRHWLLIVAVSGTVLLTNLGGARLWDRDEPRNAGCAAEMMARGDWVTPVFDGEIRIHKPVLLYWFMMSAYAVFGVSEFSARFWSALLGIGIALQTYTIGRRLFNSQVGLWSALILSTALMFDVAGRAATPDSVFMFFTTLSIMIYVLGTFAARADNAGADNAQGATAPQLREPGQWFPRHWTTVVAMYAAMALAVLAKGPAGLVLPTAVIGMFLLIMRLPGDEKSARDTLTGAQRSRGAPRSRGALRAWGGWLLGLPRPFAPLHFLRTCWYMRPVTAVLVTLIIALPWYVWVGIRTDGEFIRGFLLEHNVGRALRPMEGHGGPLLYYPAAIMLGFFPWSVFLVPIIAETTRRMHGRHPWMVGYALAACWLGVYVGLFSIARTKLPSYITPCYPGLALLAGGFAYHWSRGETLVKKHWQYVAVSCLAIVGAAILVAVPYLSEIFLPGEKLLALFGLVPLIGAGVCLIMLYRCRPRAAAISFAVTAFLFVVTLFGWCTSRVDQHRATEDLMAALDLSGDARIGALGCLEPSWVFYAHHVIEELQLPPDSAPKPRSSAGNSFMPWDSAHRKVEQPQGPLWVKRPQIDVEQFLSEGDNRYVITTDRVLKRWKTIPDDIKIVADLPYFLEKERLLVIRRDPAFSRTAKRIEHVEPEASQH